MKSRTYTTDLFEMMDAYRIRTIDGLRQYTKDYPHSMDVSQQKSMMENFAAGRHSVTKQADGTLCIHDNMDNHFHYTISPDGTTCKHRHMDNHITEHKCLVEAYGEMHALLIDGFVCMVWPDSCVKE